MESLVQDIRYAVRQLLASPGVTVVAVLTLALGIGANTAVFSVMNTIVLRSLPVSHPEELYLFGDARSCCMIGGVPRQYDIFSNPQYLYFREHNQVFRDIAAFSAVQFEVLLRNAESSGLAAETIQGKLVSGSYFAVLGTRAALGRLLSDSDDHQDAPPVIVISHSYWLKKFNASPSVIGSTLNINGTLFTIAGVTGRSFYGEALTTTPAEAWFPLARMPEIALRPERVMREPDMRWLRIIGRAKPGFRLANAQAVLTTQMRQFLVANPDPKPPSDQTQRIQQTLVIPVPAASGVSWFRRDSSDELRILLAMVGLVLLIGCTNIANLLLAKATSNQQEIWIRMALGSSRWRLIRQLMTESMLLALAGALAGSLLAIWGAHGLLAFLLRGSETAAIQVEADARVLAFLVVVSVLAGLLFGLVPALKSSRSNIAGRLGARTQISTSWFSARSRFGIGKMLVAGQVSISILLVIGAGLLVRTLLNLIHEDLGFNPEHVLMLDVNPKIAGYKLNQLDALYRTLLDHLNAVPGVSNSAITLYAPLTDTNWGGGIVVPDANNLRKEGANWTRVSPGFFETLRIPILVGRPINAGDTPTSSKVAVVSETMANRFWKGESPIGKRFGWDAAHSNEIEVVGVAKDIKHQELREEPYPLFWLPMTQVTGGDPNSYAQSQSQYAAQVLVRATGDPSTVAGAVRKAMHSIDKNLPITRVTTLLQQRDTDSAYERMMAVLASIFGAIALLLASVGLYGVLTYSVKRRTSEIGIRMALGAERMQVLWMILRETLYAVAIGIAAGVPLALAATRLLRSQLFGVSATDPMSLIGAIVCLIGAGLVAAYLPARQATAVDPMVALRNE